MDFKTGKEGAIGASNSKKQKVKMAFPLGVGYMGSGEARTDCGQEEQRGYTAAVGVHFGVFQEHQSGRKEMD